MKNLENIDLIRKIDTGNPVLNEQRRKLASIFKNMLYCITEDPDYKLFEKLLIEFTVVALKQFKLEEDCLRKHSYPKINVHTALHSSFVYQLDVYVIEAVTGTSINPYKVVEYIRNWWLNHALKEDILHKKHETVKRSISLLKPSYSKIGITLIQNI